MLLFYSNEPTPGGPLTNERIKELGIIKMNDYLATGTRQQFWEEYYVKVVMQVRYFFLIFKLYDIFVFFNESVIFVCIGIHKKSIYYFFRYFEKKFIQYNRFFGYHTQIQSKINFTDFFDFLGRKK